MINRRSTKRSMRRIINRRSRMRVKMARKRRNISMRSPRKNPNNPNKSHRRKNLSLILIRILAGMMGH